MNNKISSNLKESYKKKREEQIKSLLSDEFLFE